MSVTNWPWSKPDGSMQMSMTLDCSVGALDVSKSSYPDGNVKEIWLPVNMLDVLMHISENATIAYTNETIEYPSVQMNADVTSYSSISVILAVTIPHFPSNATAIYMSAFEGAPPVDSPRNIIAIIVGVVVGVVIFGILISIVVCVYKKFPELRMSSAPAPDASTSTPAHSSRSSSDTEVVITEDERKPE